MFAASKADVALHETAGIAAHETGMSLTSVGDIEGCWLAGPGPADLRWTLSAERARAFADAISGLADPKVKAGSAVLECNVPDEIKVKVSRGEFDDAFLTASKSSPEM